MTTTRPVPPIDAAGVLCDLGNRVFCRLWVLLAVGMSDLADPHLRIAALCAGRSASSAEPHEGV